MGGGRRQATCKDWAPQSLEREEAAGGHQVLGQEGGLSECREDAKKKEGAEHTFSQLSLGLVGFEISNRS